MSDWAKELLADMAEEFADMTCGPPLEAEHFRPVLERRLLGLLEAGEALQDALYNCYHTGKHAEKCDKCKAYVAWDAAKAKASQP